MSQIELLFLDIRYLFAVIHIIFPFLLLLQLVILIAQIKVNSMAIIRIKSRDADGPLDQSGILGLTGDTLTSNAQQVSLYIIDSIPTLFYKVSHVLSLHRICCAE